MAQRSKREAIALEVIRLIAAERSRKAISMNVLAQRSGLSQSTISLIERDLRSPSLDTLLRIAEVLSIRLGDVLLKAEESVGSSRLAK